MNENKLLDPLTVSWLAGVAVLYTGIAAAALLTVRRWRR